MKTRFCPSPTGYIHIGNLRTALFEALFARAEHGTLLLRIEDTDVVRSKDEYVDALKEDLQWLGIDWQEGLDKDQGNGPYFQSQRTAIYERYYETLLQMGLAYHCFCSPEELAIMRKTQLASGKPPRYNGQCAALSEEEHQKKLASGLKPTLRFRVPKNQTIDYVDLAKGPQHFNTNDFGDFIIRRADGTSPFVFCNAIDDALMGVTHVMRGEDHVSNTPAQIMVLQALKLPIPQYIHLSILVNKEGGKMSKRLGKTSVRDFREEGILPEALINYVARLGCYYEDNSLMDFDGLATHFRLDKLGKSPARFDEDQLRHWQKLAVPLLSEKRFFEWSGSEVVDLVPDASKALFKQAIEMNVLFPEDVKHWADIFFETLPDFDDKQMQVIQATGRKFYEESLHALACFGKKYDKIINYLKEQCQVKGQSLYLPIRLALTGEWHGPELVHVLELLDISILENRLNYAMELIED
jgi:glutamyl-tRNA synthetase